MKTQLELQAITISPDPCNADNREAAPALQTYVPDQAAADRRHDHILRAALLENACTIREVAVDTH